VLALLELLQSGGLRTASELAGRLEVDERTLRRYVGHLLDLDVPVESVRGRHGGYRLARGYRLPPLMLSEDEALAVVLGLQAGRRSDPPGAAAETALAKIARVLPERVARRLAAMTATVASTVTSTGHGDRIAPPDADVLLPLADAVRHSRPVVIGYTDRQGRRTDRVLHPDGLVSHESRWYVTGSAPGTAEERAFRLDRIGTVRTLPGSFEPRALPDAGERLLHGFATAPYRHEVTVYVDDTLDHLRGRLPASLAVVSEATVPLPRAECRWWQVEMRVEDLGWLPSVLASLDRPFLVQRPDELRDLVAALAERLATYAGRQLAGSPGPQPGGKPTATLAALPESSTSATSRPSGPTAACGPGAPEATIRCP
jgi:predicted DNA-binding transcriptional regulator YafY